MKKILIIFVLLFSFSTADATTIKLLCIGGGGGGGGPTSNAGGGGGGEFYYNATETVELGVTQTVTVGAGGAGDTNPGGTGGSSVFGSRTCVGGAGGGDYDSNGANGGAAGGGGGGYNTHTGGTGTQAGGNGVNAAPAYGGGGGGGATGAGVNGNVGATGGAGTANSITGASVTYSCGGGGGRDTTASSGGCGSAGTGAAGATNATAGEANKGNGGGGGSNPGVGAAGGSGVVIVSYVTASVASSTYTGTVVQTTDGANTVLTFTTSGTFSIYEDYLVQLNGFTGTNNISMTSAGANLVWTSATDGYAFYAGSAGNFLMSSTTDGGKTWSTGRQVDSVNTVDIVSGSVWYDRWTQTDTTGNIIHIATTDTGVDDVYYTTLDLSTGAFSTSVVATTQAATCSRTILGCTAVITKGEDNRLYVASRDGSDGWVSSCTTTCTNTANWAELSGAFTGVTNGDDTVLIAPIPSTNNAIVFMNDMTASTTYYNIFSATTSTWWGLRTLSTVTAGGTQNQGNAQLSFTYSKTNDALYVHQHDDNSGLDNAVHIWSFSPTTWVFTQMTDATSTTNQGALMEGKLAMDDTNNILHYVYSWRSTNNNAATTQIFLTSSTDGGSTWTASSTAQSKLKGSIYNLTVDPFSTIHLTEVYKYLASPDQDDLFFKKLLTYAAAAGGGGDNYQERQNIIWWDD